MVNTPTHPLIFNIKKLKAKSNVLTTNILNFENFKSDILAEIWQQDIFGKGISIELSGQWKLGEHLGMSYNVGYKTEGYVLGKQLKEGINIGAGICIYR